MMGTDEQAAMKEEVNDHEHHYVPTLSGKNEQGEDTYILKCPCGRKQGDEDA